MGRKRNHRELEQAQADEAPVRLVRTVDDGEELEGYVVALGTDWVVLHRSVDLRLVGWVAVHLDSIRAVNRSRNPGVMDRALEFWEQKPENPRLDPTSDIALLQSAGNAFPLVSLHEEDRYVGECAVGIPVRVTEKKVDLLDVSPAATWDDAPRRFPLKRLTRIEVGDDYLVALHHLAGPPPKKLKEPVEH